MSTICQDVAVLTTTTVRTTSTVFITVVNSQGVGRPILSTLHNTVVSCSTAVAANSTVRRCASSILTSIRTMTASPTIVQVTSTITRQVYQTVLNTLYRPSCRVVPGPPTYPPRTTTPVPPTTPPPPPPPPPTTTPPTLPPTQLTDTSYITEYVTVTTRPAELTSTSSMSRTTIYGDSATPSDKPIGAASPPWSSNNVPVGAITGGVIGGVALIIVLGLLTYFLIYKKAHQPLISSDQSPLHPQMQEQAGYDTYQNSTGQSQNMRDSDYVQQQGPDGQEFYPNSQLQGTQIWPQNMPSRPAVQGYAPAVSALPAGAAAASVVGHRDPYGSYQVHPSSRRSTATALRHDPHTSLYPTSIPYQGFAEPRGG